MCIEVEFKLIQFPRQLEFLLLFRTKRMGEERGTRKKKIVIFKLQFVIKK